MNQEKKNSIKWIATFMAIIVLFAGVGAALGLVIQQMKQNNTDTPIASGDGKNMFEGQIYEMPSVLAFSADATTAADSGHTASVTLTATVLPVEATNKLVDWSVAWGVTKQHGSENVTDYVNAILAKADIITVISEEYNEKCMMERNIYMVDHSNTVLGFWNGEKHSGTWNTIRYAQLMNKDIDIVRI